MWKILQADEPEDFVLATGEVHSVRDFVEAAFKEVSERERSWHIWPFSDYELYVSYNLQFVMYA